MPEPMYVVLYDDFGPNLFPWPNRRFIAASDDLDEAARICNEHRVDGILGKTGQPVLITSVHPTR